MYLSDKAIRDLNTLAGWLALDDFSIRENLNPGLLILAGHAVMPTIIGALDFAAQTGVPVLFSGGIGHSINHAVTAGGKTGPAHGCH